MRSICAAADVMYFDFITVNVSHAVDFKMYFFIPGATEILKGQQSFVKKSKRRESCRSLVKFVMGTIAGQQVE